MEEFRVAAEHGFDVEEELKKLPNSPGVYIMHDADDVIMYVGKAVNLHSRVRSYFRKIVGRGPQIDRMVEQIARFEYIVTDSELEALVLENNLIKEHRPKYNTMLKDDKTYPYIKVTVDETFPRIFVSRVMKKDKARYFGPFTSAQAVRETIELINKMYGLRDCSRVLPRDIGKERPCLNYHMGRCTAPCAGSISEEDYRRRIDQAVEFLSGNYAPVIRELTEKMNAASEEMNFEEAIRWRDLLESVKQVAQKQKMSEGVGENRDIIAVAIEEAPEGGAASNAAAAEVEECSLRETAPSGAASASRSNAAVAAFDLDAVVQTFFIRDGRLIGREHYYMTHVGGRTRSDILSEFMHQFYAGTPFIPKEIMIQEEIEDRSLIEEWLSSRRGSKVTVSVPQRGRKEKLVSLAEENAALILSKDKERLKREEGRTIGAVREIASLLGLRSADRMEAYDISNISGFANVGSMVVYEKGKPKRSDYRKFSIKTVSGPNDYACMREVLTRRFKHGMEEQEDLRQREMEEEFGSFARFPDLLLMDGGRGQVNIALDVLKELGLNIPVAGMVKDDFHRTRGIYYNNVELPIDRGSEGFKLITRIQDEAHRFAIEYHRSLRSKAQVSSRLDEIPGIGPARRKALMRSFRSIHDIEEADVETLASVPEIPRAQAEAIYAFFHPEAGAPQEQPDE